MQSFLGDGATLLTSPHDPDVIFSVGSGYWSSKYWLMVSATTDGGSTWSHDTLDSLFRGNAFAYDPNDPSTVYVAGDTYYSNPMLRVSTDLGRTWQDRRAGLAGSVVAIATVPRNPGALFCGSGSGLYKTTDAGLTWAPKGTLTGVRAIVVDTVSPGVVYAATASGVHASTDAGETWSTMNAGLPTTDVLSLALRSGPMGALYCGTNGRGVYVTDPLVGVSESPKPAAPGARLPAVTGRVLFVPASPGAAGYSLLDLAGRRVMSLGAGPNDVSRVAAGVYFVRLTAGSDREAGTVTKVVVQ